MNGVERILDRALNFARAGQRNPFAALCMAEDADKGDTGQDPAKALLAVQNVCGGSLVRWYEGQRRTHAEVVALLEDALFTTQMGGA